jgi:hypothetical protein
MERSGLRATSRGLKGNCGKLELRERRNRVRKGKEDGVKMGGYREKTKRLSTNVTCCQIMTSDIDVRGLSVHVYGQRRRKTPAAEVVTCCN